MNVELLVNSLICIVFVSGVLIYSWDDVELLITWFRLRHRLRALRVEQKTLPAPIDYISKLLKLGFKTPGRKRIFIFFEIVLLVTIFSISNYSYTPLFSLAAAIATASMPLLLLASRFEASRAKQSREGISLTSELHRQYRINNLNIFEAIEKTISSGGDYKLSSNRLCSLLMHIRSASGPIDIRDAIDNFTFSFGTSWAKMLGYCIRLSAENGTDVSEGLADIASQLNEARKLDENRRMMNSEATRMTLLLVPLMYCVCMVTAVVYLDISPQTIIRNQFFNPIGCILFLAIVLLFLINYLILYTMGNTRLDY